MEKFFIFLTVKLEETKHHGPRISNQLLEWKSIGPDMKEVILQSMLEKWWCLLLVFGKISWGTL